MLFTLIFPSDFSWGTLSKNAQLVHYCISGVLTDVLSDIVYSASIVDSVEGNQRDSPTVEKGDRHAPDKASPLLVPDVS